MLFNYDFVIDIVCFVVITFGNIVLFSYDLEMFFFHVYIFYIF